MDKGDSGLSVSAMCALQLKIEQGQLVQIHAQYHKPVLESVLINLDKASIVDILPKLISLCPQSHVRIADKIMTVGEELADVTHTQLVGEQLQKKYLQEKQLQKQQLQREWQISHAMNWFSLARLLGCHAPMVAGLQLILKQQPILKQQSQLKQISAKAAQTAETQANENRFIESGLNNSGLNNSDLNNNTAGMTLLFSQSPEQALASIDSQGFEAWYQSLPKSAPIWPILNWARSYQWQLVVDYEKISQMGLFEHRLNHQDFVAASSPLFGLMAEKCVQWLELAAHDWALPEIAVQTDSNLIKGGSLAPRGRLEHGCKMDRQGKVEHYCIHTPTDKLFDEQSGLSTLLSNTPVPSVAPLLGYQVLIQLLDPCVATNIELI